MSYRFEAPHMFLQNDDYLALLGFADDENIPSRFVILQKTKKYDEQDRKMGMDKIHIQVKDESRSLYGGIKRISKEERRLVIELEENAMSTLRVDGDIEMDFDPQRSACLMRGVDRRQRRRMQRRLDDVGIDQDVGIDEQRLIVHRRPRGLRGAGSTLRATYRR